MEPITDAELEQIRKALARVPRAFRLRLVRVLDQAMDDEDEGTLEVKAQVTGRKETRTMRQWEGFFRPVGRHRTRESV